MSGPSTNKPRRPSNRALIAAALIPCTFSVWAVEHSVVSEKLVVTRDRPSLLFATYLYHHGEEPIAPDPILDTRFRFRNEGTEPVKFGQIERSCGCMTPRLSHTTLQPGEVGVLSVPVQTINESPGRKEYSLVMHYEDPKPREVTLSIKATFPEKMVVVQPKALYLSQPSAREMPFEVKISDFRETPLTVDAISSTCEFVQVDPLPARAGVVQVGHEENAVSQFAIRGSVAGNIPAGRHHAVIVAKTDDEEFPGITVPVVVNGPAYPEGKSPDVQPNAISLVASGHPQARRQGRVQVSVPADWTISHASAWPPELSVDYSEAQRDATGHQVFDINVELTGLPASRTRHGVVQLYANDGQDLITVRTSLLWP